MGVSSFTTGDTGESIVLDRYDHVNSGRKVYLTMPNGQPSLSGFYDGYCNLHTDSDVINVMELLAKNNGYGNNEKAGSLLFFKSEGKELDFYLKFSYSEDAVYEDLAPSGSCRYQGLPPKVSVRFERLREDDAGSKIFTVSGSLSELSNAVVQFEKFVTKHGETLYTENSPIVNAGDDNYYMEIRFDPESDDPFPLSPEDFFSELDLDAWDISNKEIPNILVGERPHLFVFRNPMAEPFGKDIEKYESFLQDRINPTTEMVHPGRYWPGGSLIEVKSATCQLVDGIKPTIEYDLSTKVSGFEMDVTLQVDLYSDLVSVFQNGKLEFEGLTVGDAHDSYLENFLELARGVGSDPDLSYKNRHEAEPEQLHEQELSNSQAPKR